MAASRTRPPSVHGREPYRARQSRTWPPKPYMGAIRTWPRAVHLAAHARTFPTSPRPTSRWSASPLSETPSLSLSRAVCTGRHVAAPETDHSDQSNRSQTDQEDAPVPLRLVCTAARCIGPVAPSSSSPPWTSTRRTCTGCIDDRDGITNAAHTTRHAAPVRATSRRTADAAAGRAASRAPGSRRGEHSHAPRIGVSTSSATQL